MKHVKRCPGCTAEPSQLMFMFSAEDQSKQIPGLFSVYRCAGCGTGVTDIAVDNALLHQMYDEYYDTTHVQRTEAQFLQRRYRRKHLRRIARYSSGKRLLDIGCGTGVFVKSAVEAGYAASGVDMSPASIACGKKLWQLDLECVTVADFTARPENRGRFDVITMFSVLEHIADPHGVLVEVRTMLADGGLLAVEVPNFASIQSRLFGVRWFNLDVPRHLFHYSPAGLEGLIRSAGFDILAVSPGPAAIDYGIAASIMRMPESGESLAHKVVRKLIATPFGRSLVPLEHLLGSAGSVEVYARKRLE